MGGMIWGSGGANGKSEFNAEIGWEEVEEIDDVYENAHGVSFYEDLGIEQNFGTYMAGAATFDRVIARVGRIADDVDPKTVLVILDWLRSCYEYCVGYGSVIRLVSTD